MEGDDLVLHCGATVKRNHPTYISHQWWWIVVDRRLGTKKLPPEDIIQRNVEGDLTYIRPYGFTTKPQHIRGTRDIKLIDVNRYATGKYVCAVGTLISMNPNKTYVEATYQLIHVKCEYLLYRNLTQWLAVPNSLQYTILTLGCRLTAHDKTCASTQAPSFILQRAGNRNLCPYKPQRCNCTQLVSPSGQFLFSSIHR